MKAPPFQYVWAHSRAQALDLLAQHGDSARILAGGQSLMPMLNMRLTTQALLIDINAIEDLTKISLEGGVVTIGAMATHSAVAASPIVQRHLPLISDAIAHIAHVAIRNRGTFGGSIALADPAAEMPACCLALDGRMIIESVRGRRTVEADNFFSGIFQTALEPDELLVGVEFPVTDAGWRHGFLEFAQRRGDYAIAGGAIRLRIADRGIADSRLVFFGIGERAIRASRAEIALRTSVDFESGLAAAISSLDQELEAFSDSRAPADMRQHLSRVLLRRLMQPFRKDLD